MSEHHHPQALIDAVAKELWANPKDMPRRSVTSILRDRWPLLTDEERTPYLRQAIALVDAYERFVAQPPAVTDVKLANVLDAALRDFWTNADDSDSCDTSRAGALIAGVQAVRATLAGSAGLVVPEECHRITLKRIGDAWHCWVVRDLDPMRARSVIGVGRDPVAALMAALTRAGEDGK